MIYVKFQKTIVGLLFILKIENVTHMHFVKNIINV